MANRDGIEDGSGWGGLVYSTPEEKEIERLSRKLAKAEREVAELREVMQELADCEMPEIVWFRKLQGRARDALEAKPHAKGGPL